MRWETNLDGSIIWEGDKQIFHALCTPGTQGTVLERSQLAAAAPQMLEALVELVCCPVFTAALFEADPYTHKRWTLARAAIAEARGENR